MPKSRKTRGKKFDLRAVERKLRGFVDRTLKAEVYPHLQALLDEGQAKTKYELLVSTGMGMVNLYCEAPWQRGSWEAIDSDAQSELRWRNDLVRNEKVLRARKLFPELIRLMQLVNRFDEVYGIHDIKPTVPPREDDGTLDPADEVEDGGLLKCQTCPTTGQDGDFVWHNRLPYCDVCFKKVDIPDHAQKEQ